MEKKRKVIQVYAIIVCIVAIITFIICTAVLVSAIIDRGDPIYAGFSQKPELSSFENYKMEVMKSIEKDQAYIPDDQTIKKMYEAAKDEKINKVLHDTKSNIIVSGLLIIFCIILFFTHWLMIKKHGKDEEVPAVASTEE